MGQMKAGWNYISEGCGGTSSLKDARDTSKPWPRSSTTPGTKRTHRLYSPAEASGVHILRKFVGKESRLESAGTVGSIARYMERCGEESNRRNISRGDHQA